MLKLILSAIVSIGFSVAAFADDTGTAAPTKEPAAEMPAPTKAAHKPMPGKHKKHDKAATTDKKTE